ncbi:MAG: hypothetical protein HWN66_03890 [Candidatus Helarchaeota archaeon]|nr:hypothetical protein [Candidatus Helarchaeota archaeon]
MVESRDIPAIKSVECFTFFENITFTREFKLAEGIEVKELKDDDVEHRSKLFGADIAGDRILYPDPDSTHKLVITEKEIVDYSNIENNIQTKIDNVINTLHFFTKLRIGVSGLFYVYRYKNGQITYKDHLFTFENLEEGLEVFDVDQHIENLTEMFQFLSDLEDKSLKSALRRFRYSYNRGLSEDALIDIYFAFESLFDIDREISYRLSLYLGMLIGNNPSSRRMIFEFFRKACDIRSKIAHGSEITQKDLKKIDISSISELYDKLKEYFLCAVENIKIIVEQEGDESINKLYTKQTLIDKVNERIFESPSGDKMCLESRFSKSTTMV